MAIGRHQRDDTQELPKPCHGLDWVGQDIGSVVSESAVNYPGTITRSQQSLQIGTRRSAGDGEDHPTSCIYDGAICYFIMTGISSPAPNGVYVHLDTYPGYP